MKRILLIVPVALLLCACVKDLTDNQGVQDASETLTIQAVIADDLTEAGSKTVISDENTKSVVWTPGDKISLFYGSGSSGGSMFTSTNSEDAKVANFTGDIGVITGGADVSVDQTYFWGLYPYNGNAYCDGTSITTILPSRQTAMPGSFAPNTAVSIARSQNLGLSFYNVCSGLRIKLSKEGVIKITMKSLDGTPLAGMAKIGFDDGGVPVVKEIINGEDEIVLSSGESSITMDGKTYFVPHDQSLETGKNYYFMFYPHNFSDSYFTVTFETMTEKATYTRTRPMNFARSNIEGFNVELDKSLTYIPDANNINAVMKGVYASWQNCADQTFYGNGLFYALDLPGGDDSRHPEGYGNQLQRHIPEGLYENGTAVGTYSTETYGGSYSGFYGIIGRANYIINTIENTESFAEYMKDGAAPTEFSQVYGEAVVARATMYQLLIRYYGDVPFTLAPTSAALPNLVLSGITPRDSIYDFIIADLEKVIPHMYRSGSVPGYGDNKNVFSRTFAEATLGSICLDAAGYQTRRPDITYTDGEGNILSFESLGIPNANAGNAFYARRSDYRNYYEKARDAFKAVIDNPGNVVFHDTDPRATTAAGQQFGNPYQYFFQQTMDNDFGYADESIFEYPLTWNVSHSERPYSNGRVSNGGPSNAFPGKAYGQGRINPAWYWGVFDPKDMRRDVSCCVTGHSGGGAEVLIPFVPNAKTYGGGITNNKWDEARQVMGNVLKQRRSGINGPWMRMSEVFLGYAEACAALGENGNARTYLARIRERSFPAGQAGTDAFISSCGSLFKAVIQERAFEFTGEGDRRWTLIRTGLLAENVRKVKEMQAAMIDGVVANGYYTFENGNEFPAYVWTKTVDAKSIYGYRLTTQCPDEDDPVLYPGWRGENDDWLSVAAAAGCTNTSALNAGSMTNLAIKGLFKHIDPDSAEARALEADGYRKVEYGLELAKRRAEYVDNFFKNYDYTSAPIYLIGFNLNARQTIDGLTNGYGFSNTLQ